MVKVTDYKLRTTESGKSFYALLLSGGIEVAISSTGKQYLTVKRASLPTTFDELTCQLLIGQELPGSIQKVECEPYEYTVAETGEIVTLYYRYEYVREEVGGMVDNMAPKFQDVLVSGTM